MFGSDVLGWPVATHKADVRLPPRHDRPQAHGSDPIAKGISVWKIGLALLCDFDSNVINRTITTIDVSVAVAQ